MTRFYIECPHGKTVHVRASVRIGKRHYTFYPGVRFEKKSEWDSKKQRLKGVRQENIYLSNLAHKIDNYIREKVVDTGLKFGDVVMYVNKIMGKDDDQMYAILSQIAREKILSTARGDGLRHKYLNIIDKMKQFMPRAEFSSVTVDFVSKFAAFLYDQGISRNTVARYISFMKTLMRESYERGYHTNESFRYRNFAVSKIEIKYPFLTIDEIDQIYHHKASSASLENIRINLLIGCLTGQRHSDWHKIELCNQVVIDGAVYYEIHQQKTVSSVLIPANKKLQALVNLGPRALSLQKCNDGLKKLLKEVGINTSFTKITTKGNELKRVSSPKWQQATTHIARRSFVCNALIMGVSETIIMRVGGWKSHSAFKKYAQLSSTDGLSQISAIF